MEKKIIIPFNDWSKQRLIIRKRATSRYKKYGNVGDYFYVDDIQFEIELVIKVPLWFIAENLYRSEGADSVDEFIKVWKSIHPVKGYRPFDMVWYHHFKTC